MWRRRPPPSVVVVGSTSDTVGSLSEEVCLVPGEVVSRVDVAPNNARRIYCGVDIPADTDIVYGLLTDYEALENVVPNLVVNEVLERQASGARLRQVGSAQVLPGLNFRASMVLEVRELPDGINEAEVGGFPATGELRRGVYPQPWSRGNGRDVAMQSIPGDDGDFTLYQGLWRAQSLPSCAIDGKNATRLTFAVEIQPRPWLPVALIESRIARDLATNMKAMAAEAARRDQKAEQQSEDDLVAQAREQLEESIRGVERGGWGAGRARVEAIETAVDSLARAHALRGQWYSFDSRLSGTWRVVFSSRLAALARGHSTDRDELVVARSALARLLPRRAATTLGRVALNSIHLEIDGTTLDTIVAFRAPFAAPALRLEYLFVAPKRGFAVTMICDKIRFEPANEGLRGFAPRPALRTAWLAPFSSSSRTDDRNRGPPDNVVSFDLIHADDSLLITLDDANDLKICQRTTPPDQQQPSAWRRPFNKRQHF
ncbi:hypothetical protein CTAYLR_007302 [Chrysophaeum taylorii]|uniref:Coenzyme Q-binding protein COQ10 START domain-containing protein n=1 Tax=Chrysophaeum taylorii TaxID=2483200 RepID=A0AAD7UK79_9STRA|nr:hypothetical protein CTAYLR_007302 [Chrysophaeum taylorii]